MNFFKRLFANPQTSILGIATLVSIGFAGYAHPTILSDPQTISAILGGLGLLVAGDAAKLPPTPPGAGTATGTLVPAPPAAAPAQ